MRNKKINFVVFAILLYISFSFKDRFFEIAKQIEIYNKVFKTLNINFINEINPGQLTTTAINKTLSTLDPYTRFYNEQQVEDVRIRRAGEYAGIGVTTWYTNDGIVIVTIKEGYPADKAGLRPGDIIKKINDQTLKGLEENRLSEMLKGVPQTKIKLDIDRGSKKLSIEFKLDKIEEKAVPFYEMTNKNIGYIKLNRFINQKATKEVKKAFIELEKKGMKKLILDLRYNPGGSLNDAVNITNLFIEKDKTVVTTKGKLPKYTKEYKTKNLPLSTKTPIVILINEKSASASEIVSGSLQDYDRAVIMGERSYGKGLVQRYFDLSYGTKMKATISKYYTPSGRCIQELDYANRNFKTGKIPKFSDKSINKFTTKNGRTVYDGGGVTPDIKSDKNEITEETKSLLSTRTIFNYTTSYIRNKRKINLHNYKFTDSDFADFKNYLIKIDTLFVTKQEMLFKTAYKEAKVNKQVSKTYDELILQLKKHKVSQIEINKDRVIDKLTSEIIRHNFYERGVYQYKINNDKLIKKAIKLLNNPKAYKKILK